MTRVFSGIRIMLADLAAFAHFAPHVLERISRVATVAAYEARKTFYEQGEAATGLYIIKSGHVKLFRQSGDRTQILALLGPGDCFGADTSVNDMPSPYTVAAVSRVDVWYIPPAELMGLISDVPEFRVMVLELVSGRLRQFAALVHGLAFRDVTARLASILITRAEKDGQVTPEGVAIPRLLSQSELAAMVGTAREVIYRTFKKFEESGILTSTRDTIVIHDMVQLAHIAEQEAR